jgi:hypothetical protein
MVGSNAAWTANKRKRNVMRSFIKMLGVCGLMLGLVGCEPAAERAEKDRVENAADRAKDSVEQNADAQQDAIDREAERRKDQIDAAHDAAPTQPVAPVNP